MHGVCLRTSATPRPHSNDPTVTPMASAFSANSRTLDQLLADPSIYLIPDYQRSYSWTTKEAGQLVDDVMLAATESRSPDDPDGGYFFGAVLLMERPREDEGDAESHVCDIVDGQQRLVTLTILLAVLRDLADDRGLPIASLLSPLIRTGPRRTGADAFRIRPRGEEGAFLAKYVQRTGASLEMPDEDHPTESQSRILAVREHFAEVLHDIDDEDLERLARFVVTSCHFAVVTTRSIDRAHRIFSVLNERGRPLARNDILKAQILGALEPEARPGAAQRWDAMEKLLDGAFEELFSHIRAIEGPARGTIISGIGTAVDAVGGPQAFFDNVLEPYARIFAAIRFPARRNGLSPAVNRHLDYMTWLGSFEWIPPLMLFWRKYERDAARLEAFLARFDRLSFGLRLLGIGADKRLARNAALLQRVREGQSIDAPDSPLEFTREECRNIHYNLRNMHARSQLTCKLLLLRLNDELSGDPQRLDPTNYTVEHVLPQKPGRNSQWRVWFPDTEVREAATQSLGNLILVTRDQNDKARNLEFSRKLEAYFARPGDVPWITREIETLTEWRQEQIDAREKRLLEALNALWRFDAPKPSAPQEPPAARRGQRRRTTTRASA